MPTLTSEDGTNIAWEKVGNGPPVVLVDGATCFRDSGPMRPIAGQLAHQFSVYLYDRRGRGASGDAAAFAVEREIEDIHGLIMAAGGSASVFGISSGAALVLRAAEKLGPAVVSRLALYEPPFAPEDEAGAADDYTSALTAALSSGDRGAAVEAFLRRVGMPPEAIAGMRQAPMWSGMEAIAPTLAYDNAAMGDSCVPADLAARVRVPSLCMAGGASPESLQYGARALAELIPNAAMEVLENQTHDVSAEVIGPVLARFFSRQD